MFRHAPGKAACTSYPSALPAPADVTAATGHTEGEADDRQVSYGGERVLFARRGKPVAALVSADDLALLQRIEDAEDIRDAAKVLKEYDQNPATFTTLNAYKRERKARA